MKTTIFKSVMTMLVALFSLNASAYDIQINGIYYNLDDINKVASVVSGDNKYTGEVVIPSSISNNGKNYTVTSIEEKAFYCCWRLTSVTIPNSVTSIGKLAFDGCSGLISVHISDLKSWCEISFNYDESNPLSYAHHLFLNGIEIKDLVIPNSVKNIGDYAFCGCSCFTSLVIPGSVNSIGRHSFYDCSGLKSVTIPNDVMSIGGYAFYGCSGLTSVTIPSHLFNDYEKRIGDYAFYGCYFTKDSINNTSLSKWGATIKGDKETNDGLLLSNNTIIKCRPWATSVDIPNTVTSIGAHAFSGCSALTSVTIPNTVTSIDNQAFFRCSGLTSVTIPNSVISIGDEAFEECSGLTSVTIPNGVMSIGHLAFFRCNSLKFLTIPYSVTNIEDDAFSGCYFTKDSFINNTILTNNSNWGASIIADKETDDGLLLSNNTIIKCRPWVTSVVIPNSVTCIGDGAFSDCKSLTSVTIPNSMTSIGDYAFDGCF